MIDERLKKKIDILLERFQLEGRSILEFPEQLTAALGMILANGGNNIWGMLSDKSEIETQFQRFLSKLENKNALWDAMLRDITILKSEQLQEELLKMADFLLGAFPGVSLYDFSPLKEVMEYLLEAIACTGNKNCFFTPVAVVRLMIHLVLTDSDNTLWDPACGSGTFLVEAAEKNHSLKITGSDVNEKMVQIARINAFYHGFENLQIVEEDSIEKEFNDCPSKEKFDVIVSNPPVVMSSSTVEKKGNIAPTSYIHLQFLQKIPQCLKKDGRAAVLVNDNVLFSKRNTEVTIRRALMEYGLWAVFSLPKGTFAPYTNAKASILLLDGRKEISETILFYELHHLGYTLNKQRKRINENDIPDALKTNEKKKEYLRVWTEEMKEESVYNTNGVMVPKDWQEKNFWFAGYDEVAKNNYSFLPDIYRPLKAPEMEEKEDYRVLLDKLFSLERESWEQMAKIREIFSGDWR